MSNVLEQHAPAIPLENCITVDVEVFEPNPYGGRAYVPNNVSICSIFPEELRHYLMHAGRRKEYFMPAVPKGSYALLKVYDTYTLTRDLSAGMSDIPNDRNAQAMVQSPVHCFGVAADLTRQWAQDAPGNASGAKPGVMVIAGDRPTQLELDGLTETQTTYFRWLVMKADEYWITGQRTYITNDHRRALRWLGSEDRDWYKKIETVLFKRCPSCAEQINFDALGCRHCSTNLPKFYRDAGYTDVEVTDDVGEAVARFYQQKMAKAAAGKK
jgi:hypothetical protein